MEGLIRIVVALVLTLFALPSCSGADVDPHRRVEIDSAGVRIVELGSLPQTPALSLDEVYVHGWGSNDFEFARLFSGALLSDGSVALGDLDLKQVTLLDPAGTLVAVVGGPGEGPEEFGAILSIFALPGDTILVEDDGNLRESLIHDGAFVRTRSTAGSRLARITRGAGRTEGWIVGMPTSFRLFFEEDWLNAPLSVHAVGTTAFDSIGVFEFASKVEADAPNPLRPFGSVGAGQGRVLVTRGDRAEVQLVEATTGAVVEILRWPPRHVSLSDELWSAYVSSVSDGSQESEERVQSQRAHVVDPLPEVESVVGDDSGRLWVLRWGPDASPAIYDLFDDELRPLGVVELPPRSTILSIRGERLLTVQRNDLDVPAAVVYHLVPATDQASHPLRGRSGP
ncbi:hypothetical protein V3331_18080 [Gaopeijia maritima]|uniref:hypothetical protein n=1 Tax=Gaopeijia maritima TaxID=3119007 RepID=UPI003256172A